MHRPHLCGEGGWDVGLICMQGECNALSLVCTVTERLGFYFKCFQTGSRRLIQWRGI